MDSTSLAVRLHDVYCGVYKAYKLFALGLEKGGVEVVVQDHSSPLFLQPVLKVGVVGGRKSWSWVFLVVNLQVVDLIEKLLAMMLLKMQGFLSMMVLGRSELCWASCQGNRGS